MFFLETKNHMNQFLFLRDYEKRLMQYHFFNL